MNVQPFYPLVNVITGSPPPRSNGGIWKFIKRAVFGELGLENFMLHAFHFMDFSVTPGKLKRWMKKDLRAWVRDDLGAEVRDLFVDSGGYKLLSAGGIGLERFGIAMEPGDVLKLQLRLGATRVASLDFPYPPWLSEEEKDRRRNFTVRGWNAIVDLKSPMPYFVVHGHSREEVRWFLDRLKGLVGDRGGFGIAVGSLVPVRREKWRVLEVVEEVRSQFPGTPIHVFGVTGSLIPRLVNLGATFDSKTYVDAAIRFRMIDYDGRRWRYRERFKPPEDSWYWLIDDDSRSAEYAKIALHNLQMYIRLVEDSEDEGFLRKFEEANPRARPGRPKTNAVLKPPRPPKSPELGLIIQCSMVKPYHRSRTYRSVLRALQGSGLRDKVEIVVLSGKHGLVRERDFDRREYIEYDAILTKSNYRRLVDVVRSQLADFGRLVGYVSGGGYRKLLEELGIEMVPLRAGSGRGGDVLRRSNLEALVSYLRSKLEE